MKVRCLTVVLLSLLWVTPGCASDIRRGRAEGGANPTGLLIQPLEARKIGYSVFWAASIDLERNDALKLVELLDDLIVTLETSQNMVTGISVRDGRILWREVVGSRTDRLLGMVRYGDQIFVNSGAQMFTLDAGTGEAVSSTNLDAIVGTGPALIGNYAIFGGMNGRVFAHDLHAGRSKWAYQLTSRIIVPPKAAEFNVLAADANGAYAMLASDNGKLLWRGRTFGPIVAQPAVDQLGVFIASEDQSLYALDRADGRDRWQLRAAVPLTDSPSSVGLTIYQPVPGRGLVALDVISGQEKWVLARQATPIVGNDERVLLMVDGGLLLVNATDGAELVEVSTHKLMTVIPGPEDSLILVSPDGQMVRLNPSS